MSGFVRVNKRVAKPGATAGPAATPTHTSTQSVTQPPPSSQPPQKQPAKAANTEDISKMGSGGTMAQPIMASVQAKAQQRLLSKVAAAAQIHIPNGCKPWVSNQFLTPTGIKDLDTILGGGLPLHTLNSLITDSRTSHSEVFTKAHLWEGHMRKQRCVLLTTRPEYQAVRFAQDILRPALVNQKTPMSSTLARATNSTSATTTSPPSSASGQSTTGTKLQQSGSIDDDEEALFAPRKKQPSASTTSAEAPEQPEHETQAAPTNKKITQGSVQNALHDGTSSRLTIAWQYDKYSGKTMDDSNLSGVNDDDIISSGSSDDEDHQDVNEETKTASRMLHNAFDQSTTQRAKWVHEYDFHVVTPHSFLSHSSTSVPSATSQPDNTHQPNPFLNFVAHARQQHSGPGPQSGLEQSSNPSPHFPHFGSLQPQFHRHALVSQLVAVVNLPPSITVHNRHSDQVDSATAPAPVIPARIIVELTPQLLQSYPAISGPELGSPSPSPSEHPFQVISVPQFLYALHSLAASSPCIITLLVPATVINHPPVYSLLSSLSQLLISMASFTSQTSLSNQTVLQSQLGSAYNLFGDKHDGLLTVHRLPRLNTPSYSYKLPDSTLFLYRLKKQLTATLSSTSTTTIPSLGIAKLVLPPEISRSGDAHSSSGGGGTPKDLFDEAIVEITRKAQSMATTAAASSPPLTAPSPSSSSDGTGSQNGCPTCGNPVSQHPKTHTGPSNAFAAGSRTAKQQMDLNNRHSQMIIEENEDEDEE